MIYYHIADAKGKLCPILPEVQPCLSTRCMMWKWQMVDDGRPVQNKSFPYITRPPKQSTTHGYCGMIKND